MFAKLMRHEWRATKGVLGLLCVIILGSGVAVGIAGVYTTMVGQYPGNDTLLTTLVLLLGMVAVIAIAVCCAGGILYLIWRFYQRCFTDEGFLTFTLPVSTHEILLSSAVNTIRGSIVIFLAGFASVIIALGLLFGILIAAEWENLVWADVIYGVYGVQAAWNQLIASLAKNWGNLLLVLGSGIINGISGLLLIMLAVTMGCILAKKHRFLMGVASFYGIQILMNLIPLVIAAWGKEAFGLFSGMTQQDFAGFMSYSIIRGLGAGLLCYLGMYHLVNRKLNLN